MNIFDELTREHITTYVHHIGDPEVDQKRLISHLYDLFNSLDQANEVKARAANRQLMILCYNAGKQQSLFT